MKLRKISAEDLPLILEWRNSEEVRVCMFNSNIISEHEHYAWFEKQQNMESSVWLLHYDDFGSPDGVVYFVNISADTLDASWGFYAKPSSPRGTGTKLCNDGLRYAFKNLGLLSVKAEVLEHNLRSQKFHEKLGFIKSSDTLRVKKNRHKAGGAIEYIMFNDKYSEK